MRSFKGVNFGTLLSNPKEAEELLPDLKVGGVVWLWMHLAFVFCFLFFWWCRVEVALFEETD